MSIGKEPQLVDALKNLIALDFDAISAYQAAVDRLEYQAYRHALREFLADHFRHTQQLTTVVQELGGIAPTHADAKIFLTKGKVLLGQIGGDRGILMAMRSNEGDTNSAYENACARSDIPAHVMPILQRALADERRHRAWIDRMLSPTTQPTVGTSPTAHL